jgi:hypothetical protein
MDSSFTKIIPQNPGYYHRYFIDGSYALEWTPVSSYYSPPNRHYGICMKQIQFDDRLEKGIIIGKQGKHFKRITENTGCLYIFLKNDVIEIWGTEKAVQHAEWEIKVHLSRLNRQQVIFCQHDCNNDICSKCNEASVIYKGMCEKCYKRQEFNYTEYFRKTFAPAFTNQEAEIMLQHSIPFDYICCKTNCDESEFCRCCAGVCIHD